MSIRAYNFLPAAAAVLLLSSCASSERMVRMSGGVLDSYSIPEKHRLRSEKFQKTEQNAGSRKALNETEPGGVDGTLVNLWPFFFRSREYFAILWPLADFDPYGVAVRPFYNQEGDDKSILFPLSSWNTADGSGWCLAAVWDKNRFLLFPLVRHGYNEYDDWLYYTPFFIRNWETQKKPFWHNPLKRESFTEFCLGYGGTTLKADTSAYNNLFRFYRPEETPRASLENALRYRNLPLPGKNETTEQWADRIFATLPEREWRYAGFFPLFHWERNPEDESLRLLLLFSGETRTDGCSWGATPLLGQYETMRKEPDLWDLWGATRFRKTFNAWLLLSRFDRKDIPANPERIRKFRNLHSGMFFTQRQRRGTDEIRAEELRSPAIQEKLKELGLTLPETVVDLTTFQLFLEDAVKSDEKARETVTEYSGGFLPLFDYSFRKDSSFWCIPALLSCYDRKGEELTWWSVPLLSGGYSSPEKEVFTTAGPLIYLTKTIRKLPGSKSYAELPVYGRETFWVENADCQAEYENEYALLGLFYRGTDHFLVEKEGLPPGVVEKVRGEMNRLFRETQSVESRRKELKKRETENNARKTDTRLRELEKLLEAERLRLDYGELAEKEQKLRTKMEKLKADAKSISFDLPDDFASNQESLLRAKSELLARCTELRKHRDIGNGILWRREEFYNGDSKWNICSVLAGGETKGDYEYSHILHLLYRHTRKDDRSETLCFPFMVWKEDGEDRDFSFMWRIFHLKKTAGKTGGHILFILF